MTAHQQALLLRFYISHYLVFKQMNGPKRRVFMKHLRKETEENERRIKEGPSIVNK